MADARYRDRFLDDLIERIDQDKYPSIAQMNLVESLLPPQEMEPYLEVLLAKIESEEYPSLNMLARIQRLVASLPQRASR
jgi:hypothetical protein